MHPRRFASFLLGAWLGGSVFMVLVATHNFRAADQLLSAPTAAAAKDIHALGPAAVRALLRYEAGELNRWCFETWEWTQLGLGAAMLAALASRSARARLAVLLCSFMLLTVAIMHWYLTPQISLLGRLIDFIPPGQPSPDWDRFWSLHIAYSIADAVKFTLGLFLLGILLRRHSAPAKAPGSPPQWVRAS